MHVRRGRRTLGAELRIVGRSQPNGYQLEPVHRLGELLERGYAPVAEAQPQHALATLDAIGLCGAQEKFRNDRTVPDSSPRIAVVLPS